MSKHVGKQTVIFSSPPTIHSYGAVVGKKEGQGPLGKYFDEVHEDTKFGQDSWEKAAEDAAEDRYERIVSDAEDELADEKK